jgi:hypothetical protein
MADPYMHLLRPTAEVIETIIKSFNSINEVIEQPRLKRLQGRLFRLSLHKGNEYYFIIFESQKSRFSFRCKDLRGSAFLCCTSCLLP